MWLYFSTDARTPLADHLWHQQQPFPPIRAPHIARDHAPLSLYCHSKRAINTIESQAFIEFIDRHTINWSRLCIDIPESSELALQLLPFAADQAAMTFFSGRKYGCIQNCWKPGLHPFAQAIQTYCARNYFYPQHHAALHILQKDADHAWQAHMLAQPDTRTLCQHRQLVAACLGIQGDDADAILSCPSTLEMAGVLTNMHDFTEFMHISTTLLRSELPWGHLLIPTMSTSF